jgi:hypothetical protein
MREKQWLSGNNVLLMTYCLRDETSSARTKAGRRKFRLFMVACFRPVWDALDERAREIVEAIEKAADAQATGARDRLPSYEKAFEFWRRAGWFEEQGFRLHSCHALKEAIDRHATPAYAAPGVSSYLCLAQSYADAPFSESHPAYDRTREVTLHRHADLLRDVFGNPFRPLPRRKFPAEVVGLAQACYDDHAHYPVLADALADLGEDEAAAHCRQTGHVKGCHVVDWVLGKG